MSADNPTSSEHLDHGDDVPERRTDDADQPDSAEQQVDRATPESAELGDAYDEATGQDGTAEQDLDEFRPARPERASGPEVDEADDDTSRRQPAGTAADADDTDEQILADAEAAAQAARQTIAEEATPAADTQRKVDGDEDTEEEDTDRAADDEGADSTRVLRDGKDERKDSGEADAEANLRNAVDEWEAAIAQHEREAHANGYGDPPAQDLDELEALFEAIDPGSDLVATEHQLVEGDDGWERGRDAVHGSPDEDGAAATSETEEIDESDRQDPQDTGADPEFAASTWTDPADEIDEAMQGAADRPRTPQVVLRPGELVATALELMTNWTDSEGLNTGEGEYPDTPQADIVYPPELIRATDFLAERGAEAAALMLLEEYRETGRIPFTLPGDEPAQADNVNNEEPPGQAAMF